MTPNFDYPKTLKHESVQYNFLRQAGKGGCGVVGLYEDPKTKKTMAVKFETLVSGPGNSPLNQESVTFGILARKGVEFKHMIKYY